MYFHSLPKVPFFESLLLYWELANENEAQKYIQSYKQLEEGWSFLLSFENTTAPRDSNREPHEFPKWWMEFMNHLLTSKGCHLFLPYSTAG